jgi:hypothetical protein
MKFFGHGIGDAIAAAKSQYVRKKEQTTFDSLEREVSGENQVNSALIASSSERISWILLDLEGGVSGDFLFICCLAPGMVNFFSYNRCLILRMSSTSFFLYNLCPESVRLGLI